MRTRMHTQQSKGHKMYMFLGRKTQQREIFLLTIENVLQPGLEVQFHGPIVLIQKKVKQ